MRTVSSPYRAFLILCMVIAWSSAWSQQRGNMRGKVMNDFTKEPIPFASVYWKKAGFGVTSDSSGGFLIKLSHNPIDTLVVSYVGFVDVYKQIRNNTRDTANVELIMRDLKLSNTVEVKSKFNKGLRWWKLIVANKKKNNPYKYQNYAYELYNKMELDINNVSRDYFTKKKLLKPF
ncbi:MAG: carboxypeptidase-like regulatory domain-containing protein, partial [Sediminibacterium sp.]